MTRPCLRVVLAVGSLSLLAVAPASAQTFQSLFTKQYVRQSGMPLAASDTFAACDPTGTFRMVVTNGPSGQDEIGTDPISSGSVLVNGVEVVHESDLNQTVQRLERTLTGIGTSNTVDVRLRSGPQGAIQVTVEAAQACGLRITSPTTGTVLRAGPVIVRGSVPSQPGAHVGVTVNGNAGLVEGTQFVAIVPVDPSITALVVELNSLDGTQARETLAVTVVPADEPAVYALPSVSGGAPPLSVEFRLSTIVGVSQTVFDADGDGTTDFQGPALDGFTFSYARPGLYVPTARVTDTKGAPHVASTIIHVMDPTAADIRLQALWSDFKDAVRVGDLARAGRFLHSSTRARYQVDLATLGSAALATIDQEMTSIHAKELGFAGAEYEMLRLEDGQTFSFAVWFQLDQDGLWRLRRF